MARDFFAGSSTLPFAGRGTENGKGRAIQGPGNNSRKEGYNSAEDSLIARIDRERKQKVARVALKRVPVLQAIPVVSAKGLTNTDLTEMELIFNRYKR